MKYSIIRVIGGLKLIFVGTNRAVNMQKYTKNKRNALNIYKFKLHRVSNNKFALLPERGTTFLKPIFETESSLFYPFTSVDLY